MKKLFLLYLLSCFCLVSAQDKKVTKTGKVTFEASVPSFEEVKATNDGVTCILNTKSGEMASLALIKGFRFKIALMEEHFNENYMESDKYPKATFKGTLENFDVKTLTEAYKNFTLKGKLELHGKSKDVTTVAKIRKTAAGIEIISDFTVNASDFNIKIPAMVKNKVSNTINIATAFVLQ